MIIVHIPAVRTALLNPPVSAGTANIATPIRSTITPRFFINTFMVIDIMILFFSTANKVIITRLQKYFRIKMLKALKLAVIFVLD